MTMIIIIQIVCVLFYNLFVLLKTPSMNFDDDNYDGDDDGDNADEILSMVLQLCALDRNGEV